MVTININGKDFYVEMPDVKREISRLQVMKEQYLEGDIKFNPLWETEPSNQEDVLKDLDELSYRLQQFETNPERLITFAKGIRKKKNGNFWLKAGNDVRVATNCTEYSTDYKNIWSVLVLRLDVLYCDTCKLSVRSRTFTH